MRALLVEWTDVKHWRHVKLLAAQNCFFSTLVCNCAASSVAPPQDTAPRYIASNEMAAVTRTGSVRRAGRRRYDAWKDGFLAAAATLLVLGVVALAFVLPQPWWDYPGALLVVLALIQVGFLLSA